MSNGIKLAFSFFAFAVFASCGGTSADDRRPTPTQGPPTPTPLPICRGVGTLPGEEARAFSWKQPVTTLDSGTQLPTTLALGGGGFTSLPAAERFEPGVLYPDESQGDPEIGPGLCLLAGPPDGDGIRAARIGGPEAPPGSGFAIIGVKPILDFVCFKLDLSTAEGKLYCDGSETEGVDSRTTAEAGPTRPEDNVLEFPLGATARPGDLILTVVQQQARMMQGSGDYSECFTLPDCEGDNLGNCYQPPVRVAFTTGTVTAMKGATPLMIEEGVEGITGTPFSCSSWTMENGPGRLLQALVENDPVGGDVASAVAMED